jgi:phosphatidate cytidylyltransferase
MNNFYIRFLSSLILLPIVLTCIYKGDSYLHVLIFLVFISGTYEILILKNYLISSIILLLFFIFLIFFYEIRLSNNGFNKITFCLILTWLSDIGGYMFGKIFKGKKINVISPNKTYFGFFGALALPQILNFFSINNFLLISNNLYYNVLLILILTIASVFGDLFFSYLKRVLKIKDYSNLIPGHGGIFDRMDSLIFVVIIFNIYLVLQ